MDILRARRGIAGSLVVTTLRHDDMANTLDKGAPGVRRDSDREEGSGEEGSGEAMGEVVWRFVPRRWKREPPCVDADGESKKGRRIVGPSNLVGGTGIEPVTPAV